MNTSTTLIAIVYIGHLKKNIRQKGPSLIKNLNKYKYLNAADGRILTCYQFFFPNAIKNCTCTLYNVLDYFSS